MPGVLWHQHLPEIQKVPFDSFQKGEVLSQILYLEVFIPIVIPLALYNSPSSALHNHIIEFNLSIFHKE